MFLECVSIGIIAWEISKHSNFVFFWKKKDGFWRNSLEYFKIAKGGNFFLECVSNGISAYKISKRSKFGVFSEKMFLSEKETWNVSRSLTVAIFSRKRLKWYYCLRILKTIKFLIFFRKKMDFSAEEPWNVSRSLTVIFFSEKRLKWYYCSKILKTFELLGFFWKKCFVFR